MHRGLKSGPREPKRRTKNGHTKNLVFYEAKRVFYEAKRPQGGWREGPRLQIRLEGCEHKGRTRWPTNNGHTKNSVFYEAKRPHGGWREGPRLQIRLEGCEHKGRTRWPGDSVDFQ